MKKKSKILLAIPVLAFSTSAILASCDDDKKNDEIVVVTKDTQDAIDAKVKELEALKEKNADGKYIKESVDRYNKEIDGLIAEVKKLKTLDEVKKFTIEISAQLQTADVVTKLGTITKPTTEPVVVKGIIVAAGEKDLLLDDGTGCINIYAPEGHKFHKGDYVRIEGNVKARQYLQFVLSDVQADKLNSKVAPKLEEKTPVEYTAQQIYEFSQKDVFAQNNPNTAAATYEYHPYIKIKSNFTSGAYSNYNIKALVKGKEKKISGSFKNCIGESFNEKENNDKDYIFTGYLFSGGDHPGLLVTAAEEILKDVEYTLDKSTLNLDAETKDSATFAIKKFNNGAEFKSVTASEGLELNKVADKNEWNVSAAKECRGKITITYTIGGKEETKEVKIGATHMDVTKLKTLTVADLTNKEKTKNLLAGERFIITGTIKTEEAETKSNKEGEAPKKVKKTYLVEGDKKVEIFVGGIAPEGEKVEWIFNEGYSSLKFDKKIKQTYKEGDNLTFVATFNAKFKSMSGSYKINAAPTPVEKETTPAGGEEQPAVSGETTTQTTPDTTTETTQTQPQVEKETAQTEPAVEKETTAEGQPAEKKEEKAEEQPAAKEETEGQSEAEKQTTQTQPEVAKEETQEQPTVSGETTAEGQPVVDTEAAQPQPEVAKETSEEKPAVSGEQTAEAQPAVEGETAQSSESTPSEVAAN